MASRNLSRIVSVVLVVALPLSMMFAQPNTGAVLNASGGVMVNSTSVPRSAAVYQGDIVRTSDGYAEITLPGSTISVSPNSQIVYRWKSLDLSAGSATVNTSTGLTTRAAHYYIQPATPFVTGYQLTVSGNTVTVHATHGSLVVTGLGKTFSVADGATETFEYDELTLAKNQTPPPVVRASSKRRIPPAVWIAAAAGAGAAAWGIAASGGSVSPSKP